MKKPIFIPSLLFITGLLTVLSGQAVHAEDTIISDGLKFSISYYRNGEYRKTADDLSGIMPSLATAGDSLIAMRYLAFSYGMLNMIDSAKEVFRTALQKRPEMEIDTLECPPNIAIIFKQVKLENAFSKLSATPPPPEPEIVAPPKKKMALPIFLLAMAVGTGGGAGYYLYQGIDYTNRLGIQSKQSDSYWADLRKRRKEAYIKSGVCGGITAALLTVSISLLVKEPKPKKAPEQKKVSFDYRNGMPVVVFSF